MGPAPSDVARSDHRGLFQYMQIRQRTIGLAQEARLLVARAREFERRGAADEALMAYDMVAGLIEGLRPSAFHADLYLWKGSLLRELGDTPEAIVLFSRSLDVSHYVLYAPGVARAQNCLATMHQRRGDISRARQLYGDASLNAAAAGDQRLYALVEQNLGTLAEMLGDLEGARIRYHMSLRAARATGDDEGMAWALNNLGLLHIRNERYDDAAEALHQAAEIALARGDRLMEGELALGRTRLLAATGRLAEAEAECQRAMAMATHRRERPRMARALTLRARLERERGDLEVATASLEEARALASETEDALAAARMLAELGQLWQLRSEAERARESWRQALETFTRLGAACDAEDAERRISILTEKCRSAER